LSLCPKAPASRTGLTRLKTRLEKNESSIEPA
jgi:hypothetical protein